VTTMMMMLSSLHSRGRFVIGGGGGNGDGRQKYDDVVGVCNNDAGVSVGDSSVDDGDAPHGSRFFRCHCRGDGSVSGVAIMMLLSLVLLLHHCRFCRFHGRCQCPCSVDGGVIDQRR